MPAEELGPDAVPLQELIAPAERHQRLGSLDFVHVCNQGAGGFRLVGFVRQQHTHFHGEITSRSVGKTLNPDEVFLATLATVSPAAPTLDSSQAHISPVRSPNVPSGFSCSRDYHEDSFFVIFHGQLSTTTFFLKMRNFQRYFKFSKMCGNKIQNSSSIKENIEYIPSSI